MAAFPGKGTGAPYNLPFPRPFYTKDGELPGLPSTQGKNLANNMAIIDGYITWLATMVDWDNIPLMSDNIPGRIDWANVDWTKVGAPLLKRPKPGKGPGGGGGPGDGSYP